ncbi:hypothetical protein LWI29_033929 [Acer saccharum]|uniref:RNase H type-1 domain-containing protein n=1 Tax=Acer saccharum TaxID=4024 RepID=A0AA39TG80_ACESA|nr:hypothetical protein LWI29_033929 [Acer saccharum]
MDGSGQWREKIEDIKNVVSSFYKELFTSSSPSKGCIEDVVRSVGTKITGEMNRSLVAIFRGDKRQHKKNLESWGGFFDGRVSIDIKEAKAVYKGLLAKKSGLHHLAIESDSLNVVRLCRGEIATRSDVLNTINDIQILLDRDDMTSISYVPRICNRVAHEVARRAIDLENYVFLDVLVPSWLQKLALSYVNCNVSFLE